MNKKIILCSIVVLLFISFLFTNVVSAASEVIDDQTESQLIEIKDNQA